MSRVPGSGFRVQGVCLALACLLATPLLAQPVPRATSPQRDLDEAAFREGLRQRGLGDWLEQYLAETPAVSPVDERLRTREKLLAEAQAPTTTRQMRQQKVVQASGILLSLLADWPDHPARLSWRLELARDRLEREDPSAFDAVLLYELPGRDRAIAARLSGQAIATLQTVREELAKAWKSLEALDERSLAKAAEAGATRSLEQIDAQSAFLLVWANFYQIVSSDLPEAERSVRLAGLLQEVKEQYGWTAAAIGREAQRCGVLAMSAVGLRLTGRFAGADQAAREISEVVATIRNPAIRQGLKRTVLLAVLEQVRGPRDAGKLSDAQAILAEARAWAAKTQAGDIQTELALALAERSLLARQAAKHPPEATGGTAADLLTPAEALAPLQRLAATSTAARDGLHEALGGAIGRAPMSGASSPFALQLIAGAAIADAVASAPATGTQPAGDSRGTEIAVALNAVLLRPPAPLSVETRGELLFLLARAQYLSGAPLEAVRVLNDLAEQHPHHDRAENAARQAAAVAQEAMQNRSGPPVVGAAAAFVRAGRVLRKQAPDSPTARQLQFFIAAALDESGQFEEAAEEYARVPADDPHAARAAWARVRCLRDAFNTVAASRPASEPARNLAQGALLAARSTLERTAKAAPPADACLAADITLMVAGLLNHPSIAQYEEAVEALAGFETRYAGCPAAIAPALRERVSALRGLKRMAEARAAVEQFLAADPENAGPLMARLLDAMHDQIETAEDRGDAPVTKATAEEAAKLAERLLAWSEQHPGRLTAPQRVTVAVRRAWATLEAGHAKEALALYEQAAKPSAESLPADDGLRGEIRLGRAECLLATGGAGEALPTFGELLSGLPAQSPNWWRAYAGTLECHTRLKSDAEQIVQSIRQQRKLFPDLGGPKWARELKRIEDTNVAIHERQQVEAARYEKPQEAPKVCEPSPRKRGGLPFPRIKHSRSRRGPEGS